MEKRSRAGGANRGKVKAGGRQRQPQGRQGSVIVIKESHRPVGLKGQIKCTWTSEAGSKCEIISNGNGTKECTHHVVRTRHQGATARHIIASAVDEASRDHGCGRNWSWIANICWVACRIWHAASDVVASRRASIIPGGVVRRSIPAAPGASMARHNYFLFESHAVLHPCPRGVSRCVVEAHLEGWK